MRDVKKEADMAQAAAMMTVLAADMVEETGAKSMGPAAAMMIVPAVVMADVMTARVVVMEAAIGETTVQVVDMEVVMSDATRALATETARAEAMVAPLGMEARTRSRDAQKLNAMMTVPAVEAEAMAETATVQLAEATRAMEVTRVLMEASSRQAHRMAAAMAVRTSSRALLSMLNPALATLETRISSAWRLVC